MHTRLTSHRRVLLLATPSTYRAEAFLLAAARLNIEVAIAIDLPPEIENRQGATLALDFHDPDRSTRAIEAFAAEQPLDAILSVDDAGTLLAARASAALGLSHNAPAAAEAARDKYRMRRLLENAAVPIPRFELHTSAEDPREVATHTRYPCVVKPLQLSGSRGVIRADDSESFVAAVERLTRMLREIDPSHGPKPYLVEEFVPGFEVALEGLLDRGELRPLALFDKPDPLDGPFFEETIYVTPSRLPEATQAAIIASAAQSAAALGLRDGPMHAELRVNERGPWLIEVAGRSIGGLCARTLQFGVDTPLEELILRQACGLALPDVSRESSARGVMMIPIPEAGVLKAVHGIDEAAAVAGVEEIEITARCNYPLVPLPEGDSYVGFIFARAESPAEVEAALRAAHARLRFEIRPNIPLLVS
jgi:biotin carboxylase